MVQGALKECDQMYTGCALLGVGCHSRVAIAGLQQRPLSGESIKWEVAGAWRERGGCVAGAWRVRGGQKQRRRWPGKKAAETIFVYSVS